MFRPTRYRCAGVLATGLALVLAAPTPVMAAPAYSSLYLEREWSTWLRSGACTQDSPAPVIMPNLPITENGPALNQTVVGLGTFHANSDPTDITTTRTAITASAAATAAGGKPKAMTLNFRGSAKTTTSKPTSTCTVAARATLEANYKFTTSVPMWVTMAFTKKGPVYAEAYIYQEGSEPYHDLYGFAMDGAGTTTVLIRPGNYGGYVEGETYFDSNVTTTSRSLSGKVSIRFAPVGSASTKPSGKAKPYVTLPTARTCATHDATAKVTGNAKRAKQIATISYTVNGRKVATLKGNKVKKNKTTALKIADNKAARIQATVRLDNGKKLTARASYLACTA